ncbi:histidine kinase, partial [Amycolatopsis sp. H20-H5]|nr:histidine kinase [Amycolatopsis sp. H20-H5]
MVTRPVPASTALPPETAAGHPKDALPDTALFWRALLEDVTDAVLLQDAEGALCWSNRAAAELFAHGTGHPQVIPEADGTGRVEYAGRRLPARFRELPGGWRAWTVTALPDPVRGLRVEEFLTSAGQRLGAARGRHGTARLIAELAAAGLADCVFVLLPTTRGRWEWWSCDRAGNLGHGRIRRAQPELTPVIARTFSATGQPECWTVPAAEVATLPAIVADRLEDQDQVSVVSLGLEGGSGVTGAVLLGRRGAAAVRDEQLRAVADFARA